VSIFGAAPTAIRLFMKNNIAIDNYNLSSLRILATTGETINKEAWIWYFENVGKKLCPVINLSGGTEIGGAIISPLPVMPLKPCTVGLPVPGFDADILDDEGNKVKKGYLVIKKPWPSMTRGLLNDRKKFIETYWSKYKDMWYHGDLAFIDSDGLWHILGRVDDVIKTSGHRIGSAEIEAAVASHSAVAEATAIGIPDELKGQSIVVYVILKREYFDKGDDSNLKNEIMQTVEDVIGKFARPEQIKFVNDMPKTVTGKIMRRLIREKKAISDDDNGKNLVKDLSAVENPSSLDLI
jgi:acetyl-CoA synthetase